MNRTRDESSSSSVSVASSNGGKSKRNKSNTNSKRPNPNTVETVRMIMEQEGRSARNLVSWSIPLDTYVPHKGKSIKSKLLNSQRKRTQSCEGILRQNAQSSDVGEGTNSGDRQKKSVGQSCQSNAGHQKPVNIRARYWAYLFENLRRAIDEIYTTCEGDSSVMECKEVLLMLDNYHHEFQALIDWINLQKRLENPNLHDRPTSLAWEVRKSSPGRPRQKMVPRGVANSAYLESGKINRCLNFSKSPDAVALFTASAASKPVVGNLATTSVEAKVVESANQNIDFNTITTWADRVKGVKPVPVKSVAASSVSPQVNSHLANTNGLNNEKSDFKTAVPANTDDLDGGGWETVTSRSKQAKHVKAQKSFSEQKPSVPAIKIETVASQNSTSNSETRPKLSEVNYEGGSSYVNVVVDRIIGSGGMTSPVTSPVSDKLKLGKAAVEFSQNCFKQQERRKPHTSGDSRITTKIEFNGNEVEDKDGLRDLQDAEADFFDAVRHDDLSDDEDDKVAAAKDSPHCDGKAKTSPTDTSDFDQLNQLEEEAASLARTLHAEHDASIAVAEEQERDLLRQIQEVEDAKEQETPDIETDCDSARSSAGAREIAMMDKPPQTPLEWSDFVARFEADQQAGVSWNDLVEEEELREPGRAVQMHEKLSSPSRKRTPAESKRKQEEKHRRAEARRLRMHQEKTQKIHDLTEKVQEVVHWKNDLIRRQRNLLQSFHAEKLARAEEQRAMQLLNIKRKAQAEDTKVNEIAFINELQEQNKRHEVLMRIGEHESRIQELEQERTKMQEMKSVKEEGVKERRRALEKERQDRIEELKVKRKEQDARIEQQKIEKEKEREKLAKERARERELRLSALNAAQQEAVTELQKKIQLKHDESERRHQEQLEQRKEKAVELSLGRFSSLSSSGNLPSTTSALTSTSATIPLTSSVKLSNGPINGLSSLRVDLGEDGMNTDDNLNCDETSKSNNDTKVDSSHSVSSGSVISPRSNSGHTDEESQENEAKLQERKKMMKKRMKKLRTRMVARGKDFIKRLENKNNLNPTANKSKISRLIKDITHIIVNQKNCSGPWPANRSAALDRGLGEINRILEKQTASDQLSFRVGGGFLMLESIFEIFLKEDIGEGGRNEGPIALSDRSLSNAANAFRLACHGYHDNCVYVLYSNKLAVVVDLTMIQISRNEPSVTVKSQVSSRSPHTAKKNVGATYDVASPSLLWAISDVMCELANHPPSSDITKSKSAIDHVLMSSSSKDVRKVLESYLNRGIDVISYIVVSGIMEVLSRYLKSIRHEVAPGTSMAAFVKHGLSFLESITSFVSTRNRLLPDRQPGLSLAVKKHPVCDESGSRTSWESDPTQLLPTLQQTELMGIVSVLYGLLLHGAPERPTTLRSTSISNNLASVTSPERKLIPDHTLNVAFAVMSVLNAVAEMDLPLLQVSLGAEGLSLAFRHICTYLLWYCVQGEHADLLHQVITCVGYFTLGNHHNQDLVDSGAQPTVLQQLCLLPFSYFSNPSLIHILFPTLIACCCDNDSNLFMLEQEASSSLLAGYMETLLEDKDAKGDEGAKSLKKIGSDQNHVALPSLADSSQFNHDYLRKALRYLEDQHAKNDGTKDVKALACL